MMMFRSASFAGAAFCAFSTSVVEDAEPCFCGPPANSALIVVDMQNDFVDNKTGALAVPYGNRIIPVINRLAAMSWTAPVGYSFDYHPHDHISFASSHDGKAPFEQVKLNYINGSTYGTTYHFICGDEVEQKYGKSARSCSGEAITEYTQTLWPDHCVQNSEGAELVSDITLPTKHFSIRKGYVTTTDSYSIFLDSLGDVTSNAHQVFKAYGVKNLFITGLAQDFCVHFTAKDAKALGYDNVYVVTDATEPVVVGFDFEQPDIDLYNARKAEVKMLNEEAGAVLITSDQLECGCETPSSTPTPTTTEDSLAPSFTSTLPFIVAMVAVVSQ